MKATRLLGVAVLAGMLPAWTAHAEEVRVYTNADVEALEPLPTQSEPVVPSPDLGWQFVTEFIARERERIEARRAHDLDRSLTETVAQVPHPPRRPYLGIAPFVGHTIFLGKPRPPSGFVKGPKSRPSDPGSAGRIVPLHARPGGRIVPVHARPVDTSPTADPH